MTKAVQRGLHHTVVHCDTASKVCCGIWTLVFLLGEAVLPAGPALSLWENRRVSGCLSWPRWDMYITPTPQWIGGCGHQKLACPYILIMTHGLYQTHTQTHTRSLVDPFPEQSGPEPAACTV